MATRSFLSNRIRFAVSKTSASDDISIWYSVSHRTSSVRLSGWLYIPLCFIRTVHNAEHRHILASSLFGPPPIKGNRKWAAINTGLEVTIINPTRINTYLHDSRGFRHKIVLKNSPAFFFIAELILKKCNKSNWCDLEKEAAPPKSRVVRDKLSAPVTGRLRLDDWCLD